MTRHLDDQLSSNKWDGLILHYLGLDHIGHKGGPESPYMKPKQIEMDKILQRLYTYVTKNDDTLIVLMGDHGMNEIGNHGGSSLVKHQLHFHLFLLNLTTKVNHHYRIIQTTRITTKSAKSI